MFEHDGSYAKKNTYQMIELPQRHLSADIFSHRDQRDANDSKRLEAVVFSVLFLLFFDLLLFLLLLFLLFIGVVVLIAKMKELLDL